MKSNLLIFTFLFLFHIQHFGQKSNISFIQNKNQWESQIAYKADIHGGSMFLTSNRFRYSFFDISRLHDIHELHHHQMNINQEKVNCYAYDVTFLGANSNPNIVSAKKRTEYYNYFIGNDQTKWAGNVPAFEQITYQSLYQDIDLILYSKDNSLEYDFKIAPNANPNEIQVKYEGVKPLLKSNGNLLIKTNINEVVEQAPIAYQIIQGKKYIIPCQFKLNNNILTYEFPKGYDKQYELIIDPVLVFATYSGANTTNYGFSATYDVTGSLYAGGEAFGTGWPSTVGAFQMTFGGMVDAGINKYTATGNSLIYSTYFGGNSSDLPNNLVTNANNELVVFGSTASSNMPVTTGCYDNTLGGSADMYVVHLNATGSGIIGSTYIGGSGADGQNTFTLSPNYGDYNRGEVYVDAAQNIICAGSTSSTNFPTTAGCFQSTNAGMQDGCIFKLNPTCSNLLMSTYIGGTSDDACFAVNVNSSGEIVSVGGTMSTNFPTTAGTLHPTFQGGTDGFVIKLNSTCTALNASSFLGTSSFDHAYKMQLDGLDNVYVCGQTDGAYPVSAGVYTNPNATIFIDKLNPSLTTSLTSTVIGQSSTMIVPTAFLYDNCGNVYFSGFQAAPGLPLTANAHQTTPGGFWICVLEMNMSNLLYATFMGAVGDHVDGGTSRFDPQGIIYHSVCTASSTQYSSPGCWSPNNLASSYDVASFKFDFEAAGVNANAAISVSSNDSSCIPATIQFSNNSTGATSYLWDFGDGSATTTLITPSHTYATPGVYTVKLKAFNPLSCVPEDSSSLQVYIFEIKKPILDLHDTTFCDKNAVLNLVANVLNQNSNMKFNWQPSAGIIGANNTQTVIVDPMISNTFTVTVYDSINTSCHESTFGIINVKFGDTSLFKVIPSDTTICKNDIITLTASGGTHYKWQPIFNLSDPSADVVQTSVASAVLYSVLISDDAGCSATRYVDLKTYEANVDAGEEQTIRYGQSAQLEAVGSVTYLWDMNSSLSNINIANPVANPLQTTTYFVTGYTAAGCEARDSVTIRVTNAIIPTAFSPNGDQVNDVFYFKPFDNRVNLKSMRVYNRWGLQVFFTDDIHIGWNGMYKGKECDNGVYFYLIEYSIGNKNYTDKGDITLIR